MTLTVDSFARDGFVGPVPFLTPGQCRTLLAHLARDDRPAAAVWKKGGAVTDWMLSSLAAKPRLMRLLTPILGDDIILWGVDVVRRTPGQIHRWHVDGESAAPDGRFVTVWIGLENTSGDSSLRLIAGSHSCGKTVQEFQAANGTADLHAPTETVLEWARSANPDARLVNPECRDGDAVLFDGRMWHGSHNRLETQTRTAILLQFAAADCPVRMPERNVMPWPFKFLDIRPPVIAVHGSGDSGANQLVPPPQRLRKGKSSSLPSFILRLETPLAEDPDGKWRRYPLFAGSTPAIDHMSCHAAVLSAGHSPHPPHAHDDEELLVVLSGEAELLISDRPDYDGAKPLAVKAGDFAYYEPRQHHTIRNPGKAPLTYVMFRWRRPGATRAAKRLSSTLFRAPPPATRSGAGGFTVRPVFDGATRWLRNLHCHTSRLEPGAGYAPHIDPYDVAILMQSGRVQTLGKDVGPGSLIYYPAGKVHGMRNIGDEPAQYLVFEFHGAPLPIAASPGLPAPSLPEPAPSAKPRRRTTSGRRRSPA